MARKQLAALSPKAIGKLEDDALEEWKSVSEIKYELAKDAYEAQDAETQNVIDRIVATLRQYASGYINVQLQPPEGAMVPVKVDNEYLGYNLLWLATEIIKDLAFTGVRVANYEFASTLCAACGTEIVPEKKSGRKAGR